MNFKIFSFFLLLFAAQLTFSNPKPSKKDYVISIETKFGTITALLYDDTPLHKENFIKLVDEKFYDNTTFHRVMQNFMIQGGDPNSKDDNPNNDGQGGPGYRIKAEFNPKHIHIKGAIAAARQSDAVNPEKESSGSQFYIVQGRKANAAELAQLQKFKGIEYTEEQQNLYREIGGTPHLDMDYTVFGEVIDGLEIIDTIASQKTGAGNRPVENITMTVRVKKMRKKKISKLYNYNYPTIQ